VVERDSGYFCKLCSAHHLRSPLGGHLVWINVPCTNVDMKDAVRKHRGCDTHKIVLMHLVIAQQKSIDEHIVDANDKLLSVFSARVRDLYFLFKHHLHLNLASDLLELTSSHGAFEQARLVLKGNTQLYDSYTFFIELQLCIANVVRADVLNELKERVIVFLAPSVLRFTYAVFWSFRR
jgi:hypothetical protein